MIPNNTDILVTHGPPLGILDQSYPHKYTDHLGCEELLEAVSRVKPKINIFGHIHGGAGYWYNDGTHFVNASVLNEAYKPNNIPVTVLEL